MTRKYHLKLAESVNNRKISVLECRVSLSFHLETHSDLIVDNFSRYRQDIPLSLP